VRGGGRPFRSARWAAGHEAPLGQVVLGDLADQVGVSPRYSSHCAGLNKQLEVVLLWHSVLPGEGFAQDLKERSACSPTPWAETTAPGSCGGSPIAANSNDEGPTFLFL
jgi:hypothetical protein